MDRPRHRSGVPLAIAGILLVVVGTFVGWAIIMGSPHHLETLPCRDPSPPHAIGPCEHPPQLWLANLAAVAIFAGLGIVVFAYIRGLVRGVRESYLPPAAPAFTLRDVPRVFAALSSTGGDGSFAVILFGADGEPPAQADALNVQLSIEGGRLGIDWVLLAPLNVASQSRFVDFFEGRSRAVLRRESNEVESLRVEGDQLAELLQDFLVSEFKVRPDQKVELVAEGFEARYEPRG